MASSTQLKTQGYLLLISFFAVLVAIFDPLYSAATGEVLDLFGRRLSMLAGLLLLVAFGLAAREVGREATKF